MPEKNEKQLESVRGVSPVGGKVEELWRKRFMEKMSFESGVEVRSTYNFVLSLCVFILVLLLVSLITVMFM